MTHKFYAVPAYPSGWWAYDGAPHDGFLVAHSGWINAPLKHYSGDKLVFAMHGKSPFQAIERLKKLRREQSK